MTLFEVEQRATQRDERTGLLYRPDTVDLDILRGDARGYTKRLGIEPNSRVLDIGAHIGGATYQFVEAGAEIVVAIEADPDNARLLLLNVPTGHVAIHAGAVADERETVTLWRNVRPRGTTLHSLTEHRGRQAVEVPARSISSLVEEYGITHIKMDCEGGEYALLVPDLADSVRSIIVEFHATHRTWEPRVAKTLAHLYDQGFLPDRDPPTRPTPKAWVWTVAWHR